MNIINCTEAQINWVDILYRRKCRFLSEHCTVFWLMFSVSDLSPLELMMISQDGVQSKQQESYGAVLE